MKKSIALMSLSLGTLLTLSACGSQSNSSNSMNESSQSTNISSETVATSSSQMSDMAGMNHEATIPENMVVAENPKFPVGSSVIITADHMSGMKGADAKVVGAYDTTLYEISYEPTTGGKEVKNHKWVAQEDLADTNDIVQKGDQVTLKATHMDGMKGAKATIDDIVTGVAYAVDYTPTTGGDSVKNHMWLTEDELTEKTN